MKVEVCSVENDRGLSRFFGFYVISSKHERINRRAGCLEIILSSIMIKTILLLAFVASTSAFVIPFKVHAAVTNITKGEYENLQICFR